MIKNLIKKSLLVFTAAMVFTTSSIVGGCIDSTKVEAASNKDYVTTISRCPFRADCYEDAYCYFYIEAGVDLEYIGYKYNDHNNLWFYVYYAGQYGWVYCGHFN